MKPNIIFLALALGGTLSAQDLAQARLDLGMKVLANTSANETILTQGRSLLAQSLKAGDKFSAAETLLLVGIWHIQRGDNATADQTLTQAEALAQEVNQVPTSDTLRLLAEIRSRFIVTKGPLYAIGNGSALEDLAKRSLGLNPANQRASLILAYGKLNAPPAFGGDPDFSIRIMTPLAQNPDGPVARWLAVLGLAQAYEKKGNKPEARRWLEAARMIYPQNPEIAKLGSKL